MDPLTIATVAVAALQQVPAAITAVQTIYDVLSGGADPTPAQQAEIDAGVDAAHAALQAAL